MEAKTERIKKILYCTPCLKHKCLKTWCGRKSASSGSANDPCLCCKRYEVCKNCIICDKCVFEYRRCKICCKYLFINPEMTNLTTAINDFFDLFMHSSMVHELNVSK